MTKKAFFWEEPEQRGFLFNSYVFEIAGIELGIKKASIFYVDKKELIYYTNALKKKGYFYELSDFSYLIKNKIAKKIENQEKGTSEREGCCFLYISKDKEICQRLKKLDNYQKKYPSGKYSRRVFFEIANLLGYPKCCSEFLLSCHRDKSYELLSIEEKPYQNEVIYKLLALKDSSKLLHPLNNLNDPYPTIFNFFVCKYNCENALNIANKLLDYIKKKYPFEYEALINDLKIPMIFFPSYGAIYFSDLVKKEGKMHYSSCFFRKEVAQHNLSKERFDEFNKKITMFLEGNSFQIEDEKILIYKNDQIIHTMKEEGILIEFD